LYNLVFSPEVDLSDRSNKQNKS